MSAVLKDINPMGVHHYGQVKTVAQLLAFKTGLFDLSTCNPPGQMRASKNVSGCCCSPGYALVFPYCHFPSSIPQA